MKQKAEYGGINLSDFLRYKIFCIIYNEGALLGHSFFLDLY
jgi:hypothetical protein